MLFNSYTFIFAFLPITLLGFALLASKAPRRIAIAWLVAASIFFYGWARPENLLILGVLLVGNYVAGVYLDRHQGEVRGKIVLVLGLVTNIAVLGYYKYTNFLVTTVNAATGLNWHTAEIILPLGISFFIFQKLAYLVDAYHGKTRGYHFIDYCLFVTFFPQLIAGPIVHHSEVVPQFARQTGRAISAEDLSVGVTQFVCGLFKKVAVADRVALYASPVFASAQAGANPSFVDAWIGALAYTFQLYFDFSGYSDMALGLGRMFGIRLPQNFNSPYKAVNIVDFWRRWHMTLSRFLRDYLYLPLGGNRKGPGWRYANLMITMLLGGLWHGAGWTFLFWGGLHGVYLVINHGWTTLRRRRGADPGQSTPAGRWAGRLVTFLAVLVAWVFFRSADFASAGRMLSSMAGLHGFDWSSAYRLDSTLAALGLLLAAVWALPNTQEILAAFQPALQVEKGPAPGARVGVLPRWWAWLQWQPKTVWAIAVGALAVFTITQMSRISEFIYWQF